MTKTVSEYIDSHPNWKPLLEQLREILLSTELDESVKWGAPYYSLNNKNVVGFVAFKHHAALWFPNGVFLKDPHQKLINAQEGKTKAGRQFRFYSNDNADEKLIRDFIYQAIQNQKEGKEHQPEKNQKLKIPEELAAVIKNNPDLQASFKNLTAFKQREFAEYISEAKRPDTKEKRLQKIIPMIKSGTGLHDKYR